eukprot:COSAG02_NODE_2113_length_9800_cov_53.566643_10_plen_55_part_00
MEGVRLRWSNGVSILISDFSLLSTAGFGKQAEPRTRNDRSWNSSRMTPNFGKFK